MQIKTELPSNNANSRRKSFEGEASGVRLAIFFFCCIFSKFVNKIRFQFLLLHYLVIYKFYLLAANKVLIFWRNLFRIGKWQRKAYDPTVYLSSSWKTGFLSIHQTELFITQLQFMYSFYNSITIAIIKGNYNSIPIRIKLKESVLFFLSLHSNSCLDSFLALSHLFSQFSLVCLFHFSFFENFCHSQIMQQVRKINAHKFTVMNLLFEFIKHPLLN